MEIRFAVPRDVPGILSLLRQVGAVHHQGRPDIFREHAQKYGASQVLAMLVSALMGSHLILDTLGELFRGKFTANTLLVLLYYYLVKYKLVGLKTVL